MASTSISDLLERAKQAKPEHRDVSVVLDRAVAEQVDALNQRISDLEQQYDEQEDAFDRERAELTRDARMADPRPAELDARAKKTLEKLQKQIDATATERDELMAGVVITLRFTRMLGQAWSEITSRNPARIDVTADQFYGYNYHEVAKQAASYIGDDGTRYGQRVTIDDAGNEALEDLTVQQWLDLFVLLAGSEFERIASTLLDMNDYGPRQRAAAAKKA